METHVDLIGNKACMSFSWIRCGELIIDGWRSKMIFELGWQIWYGIVVDGMEVFDECADDEATGLLVVEVVDIVVEDVDDGSYIDAVVDAALRIG